MSKKGKQKSDSPTCSDYGEGGVQRDNSNEEGRIIDEPAPNDVLCGKDRNFNKHHGNQIFREVVDAYLDVYERATCKPERKKINKIVIESLRSKYNTRFLRPCDGKNGKWEQISEQLARDKLSHAFRFQQKWQRKISSSRSKKQQTSPPPGPTTTCKTIAAADSVSSSTAPRCLKTKQSAWLSLENQKRAVSDAKSIAIERRRKRSRAVTITRAANNIAQHAASAKRGGVDVNPVSDAVACRRVYLSECVQQQQQQHHHHEQQQQPADTSFDWDIETTEKAKAKVAAVAMTSSSISNNNNNAQPDALLYLPPAKSFSFSPPSRPTTKFPEIALATTSTTSNQLSSNRRKLNRQAAAHSIVLPTASWPSLSLSLQNNNNNNSCAYAVLSDARSSRCAVSSSNDRCTSRATIAAAKALEAFDANTFIGQDHLSKQKKENDIRSSGDDDDRILAGAAIETDATVAVPVNKANAEAPEAMQNANSFSDQQQRASVLQTAAVAAASNAFDDSNTSVDEENGGTAHGDEVHDGLDCGHQKDDGSDLEPLDFNDFGLEECNYPHLYHHPTLLSLPNHDYNTAGSAYSRGDVQFMEPYIGSMQERPLANQLSHKYMNSLGCGSKQPPNLSTASLPSSFSCHGDLNAFPSWEQMNFLNHQEPAVSTFQHTGFQHPIQIRESNSDSNDIASSYNVMGRWHGNNRMDANSPSTLTVVPSNEQSTSFDLSPWVSNGNFLEQTNEELDALIMQGANLQQQQQQQQKQKQWRKHN